MVKRKAKPPPLSQPPLKSRRVARLVTTAFHRLTHEVDRLKAAGKGGGKEVAELETAIAAIGGRRSYQDASIVSTTHFKVGRQKSCPVSLSGG